MDDRHHDHVADALLIRQDDGSYLLSAGRLLPGSYADRDAAVIAYGYVIGGETKFDLEDLVKMVCVDQARGITVRDFEVCCHPHWYSRSPGAHLRLDDIARENNWWVAGIPDRDRARGHCRDLSLGVTGLWSTGPQLPPPTYPAPHPKGDRLSDAVLVPTAGNWRVATGPVCIPGVYDCRDSAVLAYGIHLTEQDHPDGMRIAGYVNGVCKRPITPHDLEMCHIPDDYTPMGNPHKRIINAIRVARWHDMWAVKDPSDPRVWHKVSKGTPGATPNRLAAVQLIQQVVVRVRGHEYWTSDDRRVPQEYGLPVRDLHDMPIRYLPCGCVS
jgi:hypothetical protein